VKKCFICSPGFRIPDYKHKNINSIKLSPFLFLSLPSSSISFSILLISLPSSFSISPRSFLSFSLSHFATSILHVVDCLSFRIAHSASSFHSFYPTCFLSSFPHLHLVIIFLSLSPELQNFFCHTPLVYLDSLIVSRLSYFSVPLSLLRSSTFIHLPFALNLSTSMI
jgi:hypothetical protein